MKAWFERLPIHRKLVTLALLITGVALGLAMVGLSAFDVWRYREAAAADTEALARVVAENTAAAVVFGDAEAARETLQSVRVRGVVTRACLFLPDGTLFAGFARPPASCPGTRPASADEWAGVIGTAPVTRADRMYGTVYVERNLSDLRGRLLLTVSAGLMMFVFAATAAYFLAERVHAAISRPISLLAGFARRFGDDPSSQPPLIDTSPDELGDLVRSFGEMLARVRKANEDVTAANEQLRRSNEALVRENEERRRVEAEREAALAREREASRLKDEFLAAVSHELRTPLNAMMGWAQILATTRPSEDTIRKAVTSIVKNAQAQTRVIEDLIDVSRIVTGKLRLTFAPLDVRPVLASAIESMEPVAAAKGVRLERSVPRESCFVAGDRDRLQQVIWNLVSNAVKFTPSGGTVSVRLSHEGESIRLAVSDTGAGISPTFLPHVFDRFRQADGSMTREHGGLGLGLAIVKELTELHGGRVFASSDGPDRGATFTIMLPECGPAAEPEEEEVTGAEAALPSLGGIRVVAVDDNEDAVAIIATALARAGAAVETFTSPESALAAWRHRPGDVLVCDLAMPHMSGLELLGRIRQLDAARGAFTPALAISAHASEQHRAESLKHGFQFHLAKPLDQASLVRSVAEAVAQT